MLLLEQALCQLVHPIEVPDDLEFFGPFLDHDLESLVLLLVLGLVFLDLLELDLHLLHPLQMLEVDLKVLLGLLFFVLEEVIFEVQLVLPARALSLDDEPMVSVHALHGGVASGFKVADGFHGLEDLVHFCHAVCQNVLGVTICISLFPCFLEHLLEAPLFHEYLVKLLFRMRELRPLDQDVRFQAIEVHDLVLPLGPEVSCEYR